MCTDLNSVINRGKDKLPIRDMTGVVYKLNCKECDKTYVGETKRALGIRVNEHFMDTKNKRDKVISNHCNYNNHNFK